MVKVDKELDAVFTVKREAFDANPFGLVDGEKLCRSGLRRRSPTDRLALFRLDDNVGHIHEDVALCDIVLNDDARRLLALAAQLIEDFSDRSMGIFAVPGID